MYEPGGFAAIDFALLRLNEVKEKRLVCAKTVLCL